MRRLTRLLAVLAALLVTHPALAGSLTLLGAGKPGGVAVNPLDLQFASGTFAKNGTSSGTLAGISGATVTTPAGFADTTSGALTTFAANAGRYTNKGLLVEQASTNLLSYSTDLSNATYWTVYQVTLTSNATTAPDGTTTAAKLVPNTVNDNHLYYPTNGLTVTAGGTYTTSVYAKANGYSLFDMRFESNFSSDSLDGWYDLSAGTKYNQTTFGAATLASATIEPKTSSWHRTIVTGVDSANTLAFPIPIIVDPASNLNITFVGDNTNSIYTWGEQVEALSFATSLIQTTGSSATRALDNVAVTLTPPGVAFHMDVAFTTTRATGATRTLFDWHDGSDSNKILLQMNASNQLVLTVINAGSSTVIATEGGTPAAARSATATVTWSGTQWSLAVGGSTVATTTASKPAATAIQIGYDRAQTAAMNDYLTSLVVYPN